MVQNDRARYEVWLTLADKFDYVTFTEACVSRGLPIMQPLEFSHKSGMLRVATKLYPDKDPVDAYLEILAAEAQITTETVLDANANPKISTVVIKNTGSCCGGGQVL